jgi:hypothetical protein
MNNLHFVLSLLGALAPLARGQSYFECDVFVTEEGPGKAYAFHGSSGIPDNILATIPNANLMAIHTGGPGQHVLLGASMGGVREVHRTTGALIKVFNPTGGWQWAGVFAANGDVLIGDMTTNDIRRYDPVTANYINTFGSVPGPADMVFGPNGNLFVCSYSAGGVFELNGTTGTFVAHHAQNVMEANDIVFMPDGRRIITSMRTNLAFVFGPTWNPITTFAGTGWGRPHGIDKSPHDGHIYVADGVTNAVHRFDPTTYAETHANWIVIDSKPVDVEFRIPSQLCGNVIGIGPGCGGLTIGYAGIPEISSTFTLRLTGGLPNLPALLSLGDSATQWFGVPLPIPLAGLGAPQCSILVSQLFSLGARMDATGSTQIPLAVPGDRSLIGGQLFFQWIALDPRNGLGLSTSDALEVRLGG